jgi:hypothetical protein
MMRTNLELKVVSVSPPIRGRSLPALFASVTSESGWLERAEQIPAMTTGRKTKIYYRLTTSRRCLSRAMRALTETSMTLPKTPKTALTGEVPQGALAKPSKRNQ